MTRPTGELVDVPPVEHAGGNRPDCDSCLFDWHACVWCMGPVGHGHRHADPTEPTGPD